MTTSLETFFDGMLPAIESGLKSSVALANDNGLGELHYMLAYHLGWEGEGAGAEARGKRLRPLLVLLTTAAAGADWQRALPAAVAVELVHNFSLIHDDIEDSSPLRRGRPTVWTRWGIPQAINAGDAMFTLAHLSMLRLADTTSPEIAFKATEVIQRACLHLTQGQYLDISYETRRGLTVDAYWPMVSGKTAALLAACTHLGAMSAGASSEICESYRQFGRLLGLAFQVQDDYLGIWGDAAITGKPAESDLVSGKKSLPVLFGLSRQGSFAERWAKGPIAPDEVNYLAQLLELEGAREMTLARADELTRQALDALNQAEPRGEAGAALRALAQMLLNRQG